MHVKLNFSIYGRLSTTEGYGKLGNPDLMIRENSAGNLFYGDHALIGAYHAADAENKHLCDAVEHFGEVRQYIAYLYGSSPLDGLD